MEAFGVLAEVFGAPPHVTALGTIAVAIIVLLVVCHHCRRKPQASRKPVQPKLSHAEQVARARQRKERQLYATGHIRICRFCEVPVTPDHSLAHISGKKHQRLADTTDEDEIWQWVKAPTSQKATESVDASASRSQAADDARDGWLVAGPSKSRAKVKKGSEQLRQRTADRAPKMEAPSPEADDVSNLPTLGFKPVDGVDKVLPLIIQGYKTVDLRSSGSRLSDGTCVDDLPVGFRFVGIALIKRLRYQVVLEVSEQVTFHASHGDAWLVYRERCLPPQLCSIRSAHEAQRFIEKVFYNDLALVPAKRPVTAIPVRVVQVLDY